MIAATAIIALSAAASAVPLSNSNPEIRGGQGPRIVPNGANTALNKAE